MWNQCSEIEVLPVAAEAAPVPAPLPAPACGDDRHGCCLELGGSGIGSRCAKWASVGVCTLSAEHCEAGVPRLGTGGGFAGCGGHWITAVPAVARCEVTVTGATNNTGAKEAEPEQEGEGGKAGVGGAGRFLCGSGCASEPPGPRPGGAEPSEPPAAAVAPQCFAFEAAGSHCAASKAACQACGSTWLLATQPNDPAPAVIHKPSGAPKTSPPS